MAELVLYLSIVLFFGITTKVIHYITCWIKVSKNYPPKEYWQDIANVVDKASKASKTKNEKQNKR